MITPRTRKWTVRVSRWDVYEFREVEASSANQAEERAIELYDVIGGDWEHIDSGIESVRAEPR